MYHYGAWIQDTDETAHKHLNENDWRTLSGLSYGRHTIIEVGCNQGGTTRLFAQGAEQVFAVDWFKGDVDMGESDPGELQQKFSQNCADVLESNRVILYAMDTLTAAEQLRADGVTADMIFIDADHSYEACKADIEAYLPLLRKGGVLCGHDVGSFPSVTQAVEEAFPNAWVLPDFIWLWREKQNPMPAGYSIVWDTWTTRHAVARVAPEK